MVFPGRSQAQFSLSLFYFVKNPHNPTLVNAPFPGVSWQFPGALFFFFSWFKFPQVLLEKFFFLNLLLLCRVFPWCFPGVSGHNFLSLSFTLLKIPTTFAKEAPLIQNISKCTFPWCFPGISWVFPGCSRAFFFAHSCFC